MPTINPGGFPDKAVPGAGQTGGRVLLEVHGLGELDEGDVAHGGQGVPLGAHDDFLHLDLDGGDLGLRGAEEVVLHQGPLLLAGGVQGLEVIVLVQAVGGSDNPLCGHQGAATHVVRHCASELRDEAVFSVSSLKIHIYLELTLRLMLAIQGNSLTLASTPPTILLEPPETPHLQVAALMSDEGAVST